MDEQHGGRGIVGGMARHHSALAALLVVLTIFLAVKTIGEWKKVGVIGKDVPPQAVVSVSGDAERFVKPDTATVSFTVRKDAKTVAAAQEEVTKKANAVIDALKALGVEEKDIKTISYTINPKYEWNASAYPCSDYRCPPGKQVLVGYEVSHIGEVKVRKIDDTGTVLGKLGELGITEVGTVAFSIEDEDKVRAEARAEAIKEAQAKAEVLADDLGVNLVRIVSFSENGGGSPIYYAKTMEAYGMGGTDAAVPAPRVPTGENQIISNVTITYEVR